jgi:hypothetical protein
LLRAVMSTEVSHVDEDEDGVEDWYTRGAVE